jgi:hypothetical protein
MPREVSHAWWILASFYFDESDSTYLGDDLNRLTKINFFKNKKITLFKMNCFDLKKNKSSFDVIISWPTKLSKFDHIYFYLDFLNLIWIRSTPKRNMSRLTHLDK